MKRKLLITSVFACLLILQTSINTAFAEDDVCNKCVKSCAKDADLDSCKVCCVSECALKEECSKLQGNCEAECKKALKQ